MTAQDNEALADLAAGMAINILNNEGRYTTHQMMGKHRGAAHVAISLAQLYLGPTVRTKWVDAENVTQENTVSASLGLSVLSQALRAYAFIHILAIKCRQIYQIYNV